MNLVIDQGNTRTKAAIFQSDILIKSFHFKNFGQNEITDLLRENPNVKYSILSSVINSEDNMKTIIKENTNSFLELNMKTPLPFKNLYESPDTLGIDRIAAISGAYNIYPGENVLVIDIGTAITFDFVNSKKEYLGGNISPGVNLRFKALHEHTSKLPLLSVRDKQELIAMNTESAINSGVINGIKFEIDTYIGELKRIYKNLKIILTGGDCFLFDKKLKSTIFVNSNLVLSGLNYILNYNLSDRVNK